MDDTGLQNNNQSIYRQHRFVFIKQKHVTELQCKCMKQANFNQVPSTFRLSMLTGEGRVSWGNLLWEREREFYIFQVQMWAKSFPSDGTNSCVHFKHKWLACLGVPVGDQSHGHDVLQHGPGGEELLADEDSAAGTQTLVVQSDSYCRNRLVRPAGSHLHTLLLNLHGSSNRRDTRLSSLHNVAKEHLFKILHYGLQFEIKFSDKKFLHDNYNVWKQTEQYSLIGEIVFQIDPTKIHLEE